MMSVSSHRPRLRAAGLLALTTALTVTACGPLSTGSTPTSGSAGGATGVTAALYPLQWLTERVGGPDVTVTGLTRPGVEPHDLELTPPQIAELASAGLVVYIRGVQPAVDEAVEQHAADRRFDVAAEVETLPAPAEGGHGEAGDRVGHDPHIWLDPSRLATVATRLGERLAVTDPAHAPAYRERAAKAATDLQTLDAELTRGLSTCASKAIVTSHTAFDYLADRYKLHQIGISGIDPEGEPSPARLAEVAKVAKQEKVTTIFTETLVSPKVAEVLAGEVGAKVAVLDPIESPPANGDYLSAMRQNLATLQAALRCS